MPLGVAEYFDELRTQATPILARLPALRYEWRSKGELVFPAKGPQGFEVILQPEASAIIVLTNVGLRLHREGSPLEAVTDALGVARDLLSSDMRIRERRAGTGGYRWILERLDSDGWRRESETGLLFWNYFGRRSEFIYQNHQLPGRLSREWSTEGESK
jgi:hypothetical protein